MMIAVKLSEFITLCGILRGSIYIDGILLSFLFCFDYAVFPATSIFFCDHLRVRCPMCRAVAGCATFRTMLHTGFELRFQ
jgi:hypothetical protein